MKAIEEYERLCELASSDEGWKIIETSWMMATNHVACEEHGWNKKGDSAGSMVGGFAMDIESGRTMVSGNNHLKAHSQMVEQLIDNEDLSCDEAEWRSMKGWIGNIEGFENRCIFIADVRFFDFDDGKSGSQLVARIERQILEQNIGLPLMSLFFKHREKS